MPLEHPYRIHHVPSGDVAYAGSMPAALVAAHTLLYVDNGNQGSVYVMQDSTDRLISATYSIPDPEEDFGA
jgi:hypothetical protein